MVQIKVKNSWTDAINGSKMMTGMAVLTAAGTVRAWLHGPMSCGSTEKAIA